MVQIHPHDFQKTLVTYENSRLSQQLISANENAKAAEDLASKMEAQAADKGGKLERVQAVFNLTSNTLRFIPM